MSELTAMEQYVQDAVKTKSDQCHLDMHPDVLHAIIGVATESGELLDQVKKNTFYGKPIDIVNLNEEMGDIMWYIAIYCNAMGITFEQLARQNIAKLKKRFPSKFTNHHANNRDLFEERNTLEEYNKVAHTITPLVNVNGHAI